MSLLKKPLPLHPFLFAVYPILFLYAQNVDLTPLGDALIPMALAAAVSVVLLLVLWALLRDGARAGLLVSLSALLFFSYGHFVDMLEGVQVTIGQSAMGLDALLMPVWALLFALGVHFVVGTRRKLTTATNPLNVVAAVLVLFSLTSIVSYQVSRKAPVPGPEGPGAGSELPDAQQSDALPDIYYIILDAYTSAQVLEDVWEYDNSAFIDYLTRKGFYVVPDAHSNYLMTFLSLASSLNMEYLDYLSESPGADSNDPSIPNHMIQDSEVVRFLKARGYKFVHFQTGWGPTARNDNADRDIECGNVNEFTEVLVRTTLLRPLADRFISHERREVILCTFATLPEVQHSTEGPRFVFAHILAPHAPFLFGPLGEPINNDPALRPRDWSKYYLGQLEFITSKTEELVDRILAEAETPPIIILQGDHGSRSLTAKEQAPMPQIRRERLGILNAYYLPGDGAQAVYDSITPVNTFRLVFNLYFDADYELLDDRIYFAWVERPYDFKDVTETLATQ